MNRPVDGRGMVDQPLAACITQSCGVALPDALPLQARIAAEFLASPACREGRVGAEAARVMGA